MKKINVMTKRSFLKFSLYLGVTFLFISPYKNEYDKKYKILSAFLKNFKNQSQFISVNRNDKNNFINKILNKKFENINELKSQINIDIINEYKNNKLKFNNRRIISETEYFLYGIKI